MSSVDDLHSDVQPPGARLRLLHKPADYEDLSHLSEAEKDTIDKILVGFHEQFGSEPPHFITAMLNDPALYVVWGSFYNGVKKLLGDSYLDKQVRGSVVDLMYVNIMKHWGCQQGMETYIENYVGRDTYDVRKTVLIDFPDSDVFSAEERLAIRFSNAVLGNAMTDEIFDEALERWGVKMTLRYIAWIGTYSSVTMFLDALALTGAYNGNPAEYRHGYKNDEAFEEESENFQRWHEEFEREGLA